MEARENLLVSLLRRQGQAREDGDRELSGLLLDAQREILELRSELEIYQDMWDDITKKDK
jgi:hypothetical protein